jgi:predicted nucleotidyltransferase
MDQDAKLPEATAKTLEEFVATAHKLMGTDLHSIVLFGSAAEGRMRATSDVNVLVVLKAWVPAKLDALTDPLRNAHAAILLSASFVLLAELPAAMEAFAVKYADIVRRHRVLCGTDPFVGLAVARPAEINRLRQVLLNLLLRMRERYLFTRLREEQTSSQLAQVAGPLRAAAAALLELEGTAAPSPKAALESVAGAMPGQGWPEAMATLSRVREGQSLDKGVAPATLLRLVDLAAAMHERARKLV